MQFTDLGLAEPLLRAIREQGYDTPTPIQAQAIPAVLKGGDLMAGAQTGTGKTAGFTLPMLHRLAAEKSQRDARGRIVIRTEQGKGTTFKLVLPLTLVLLIVVLLVRPSGLFGKGSDSAFLF